MKKKTLFNANWLQEDWFKSWFTSVKDGNKDVNCARKKASPCQPLQWKKAQVIRCES